MLFLVSFAARKISRNPNGVPLCPPGTDVCAATGAPTIWDSSLVYLSSYASQSFEGLGRALNGVWNFGGGLSHSGALSWLAETLFGITHGTVITNQLEKYHWSATDYWSTGLTWLANDVPWTLVPLVIAAQGFLLAIVWRSALRHGDWLSVALFSYSWLSLFFMMQNLQLAISGPIYLGYLALVVAYVARSARQRMRRNRTSSR